MHIFMVVAFIYPYIFTISLNVSVFTYLSLHLSHSKGFFLLNILFISYFVFSQFHSPIKPILPPFTPNHKT